MIAKRKPQSGKHTLKWSGSDTGKKVSLRRFLSIEEQKTYDLIPEEIDYVSHASFAFTRTEKELFGIGNEIKVQEWTYFLGDNHGKSPKQSTGQTVLTGKEEETLFLRYNYARYRLSKLIKANRRRPTAERAQQMARWYARALKARSDIVKANLALVLTLAKRARISGVDFSELVSEGNMALLRSVEKFDVSRGFKFSTYACRSIFQSFNRMATKTGRYRQRFPVEFDPRMERSDYNTRRHEKQREDSIDALGEILAVNRAKLTDIEQMVVAERFAIRSRGKGGTLAEVGKTVGMSKEGVRQIQNIALDKLRLTLAEQFLIP